MSYSYPTLINNYLTQSHPSGSTANDRMSFKGHTLYSYKSKLFQRIAPDVYILDIGTQKYSVTTAKHTSIILGCMPSNTIIYRTYTDNTVEQNVLCYIEQIKQHIGKFTRARTTKDSWKRTVHSTYTELQSYMEFYKFDKRTSAYKQFKQLFVIMFEAKVL